MFKKRNEAAVEEESYDLAVNDEIPEEDEDKDWLEAEGKLTIDVYQTPSEIVIKSAVAGVKQDNLDISITGNMVSIRGEREIDEEVPTEDYFCRECFSGKFGRSVILPCEVDPDRASASLKSGFLTIRLPKIDKDRVKKIKIRES